MGSLSLTPVQCQLLRSEPIPSVITPETEEKKVSAFLVQIIKFSQRPWNSRDVDSLETVQWGETKIIIKNLKSWALTWIAQAGPILSDLRR